MPQQTILTPPAILKPHCRGTPDAAASGIQSAWPVGLTQAVRTCLHPCGRRLCALRRNARSEALPRQQDVLWQSEGEKPPHARADLTPSDALALEGSGLGVCSGGRGAAQHRPPLRARTEGTLSTSVLIFAPVRTPRKSSIRLWCVSSERYSVRGCGRAMCVRAYVLVLAHYHVHAVSRVQ
jgi:hypothetical protein